MPFQSAPRDRILATNPTPLNIALRSNYPEFPDSCPLAPIPLLRPHCARRGSILACGKPLSILPRFLKPRVLRTFAVNFLWPVKKAHRQTTTLPRVVANFLRASYMMPY